MRVLKILSIVALVAGLLLKSCSGASNASDGPAGAVAVPDVVGLYGNEAKDLLKDLGFKIDFESIDGEKVIRASKWIVVAQDPEVDEAVDSAEVFLTVARPEDAQEIRAVRLVLDSLPQGDTTWDGATGNAVRVDESTMCVDRFYAAGNGAAQGDAAGFVIVSFPQEDLGQPKEGTCAENGMPGSSETLVPESEMTLGQKNAVRAAEDYLAYTGFSRSGLIGQLEYEGYSTDDATFAVDQIAVDWNSQAARVAQQYLDYTSFSRQSLLDQLIHDGFSPAEAEYGVGAVGY